MLQVVIHIVTIERGKNQQSIIENTSLLKNALTPFYIYIYKKKKGKNLQACVKSHDGLIVLNSNVLWVTTDTRGATDEDKEAFGADPIFRNEEHQK